MQRSVIAQIEAAGGEFWTVSNGRVSHETADGELVANMQGSVNHFQRRYAREKSWLAVEVAIEECKVPWPVTRPGYLRDSNSRLTPDPELGPVIGRAFELRDGRATIAQVRSFLADNGIRLTYAPVMKLLSDRIYLGEIHFGSHTPNLRAHKAIVDRDLFDRVQGLKLPRGRIAKSSRLLARLGVLLCCGCEGRMVAARQTQNGRVYGSPTTPTCARSCSPGKRRAMRRKSATSRRWKRTRACRWL
jgi:hypothetical protein